MYGSLSWIEWFERLDRVLGDAQQDVTILGRTISGRAVAALERSKRQLSALTDDLRLLDRSVLAADSRGHPDRADNLQKALDTAVFRLGALAEVQGASPAMRDRALSAIDAALRDSRYEAASLLEPRRRSA
jgi:hypothetical protein